MRYTVLLFAAAAEAQQASQFEIELPPQATIAQLKAKLSAEAPNLAPLLPRMLFAVDAEYATDQTELTTGCEIACIPPVSGG